MAFKPIDLQTNISQMVEVAKNQSLKSDALAEQQHFLDKEAADNSKEAATKLDEMDETEKGTIQEEKDKKRKKKYMKKNEEDDSLNKDEKRKVLSTDDKMGRIIDVLK